MGRSVWLQGKIRKVARQLEVVEGWATEEIR